MYVSASTLICDGRRFPELEQVLGKIGELGFRAVDLGVFHEWQDIQPGELADDVDGWIARATAALSAAGITQVSSLNCSFSGVLSDPDPDGFARYVREFRAVLDLAEGVGAPNVTLQPGPYLDGCSPEQQVAAMREHCEELAAIRGDRPVTIGLEAHAQTPVEDPAVALSVLDGLWPGVGISYDPSHPEMQSIPLPDTAPLLDRTVHVHVRNASVGRTQETMAAGTVDFAWLVGALRERGYQGGLAIEHFNDFDPDFTSTLALRDRLIELGVGPTP